MLIGVWLMLECQKRSTEWEITWKKICRKTTAEMRRHKEGILDTAAYFHWRILKHTYGLTNTPHIQKFIVMSLFIYTVNLILLNTAVLFDFLKFLPKGEFFCHS
jgi:hypothetical protein